MGGIFGWSAFGINSGKGRGKGSGPAKGGDSRSKRKKKKKEESPKKEIELEGKVVGLELHGTAAASLYAFGNKDNYRAIARHVAGQKLTGATLAYQVAYSCTTEIRDIASACKHLYVVSEGNYAMKAHEKSRRANKRSAALASNDYKQASRVTDCMIELIRQACVNDTRLKDKVTFVNPVGEGEPNLMKMLDCGEIDVAILPSCDVDCTIYLPSKGILAINPTVHGDAEDENVVVEAVPIDFSAANIWKNFDKNHGKPDKDIVDLSSWGILERATLAACVGHDYDSASSAKGHVSGLKGASLSTSVDAITKAISDRGKESAIAFVKSCFVNAKPSCNDHDILRLTAVVLGIIAHPTLVKGVRKKRNRNSDTTWTSEPYCNDLDDETLRHIKMYVPTLHAQLEDAKGAGLRSTDTVNYIACTRCNIDHSAYKEHCDHNIRTIAKEFDEASKRQEAGPAAGFQTLSESSLPALEEGPLDNYIASVNQCSKAKVKKDGMNRAWDSRGYEDSGRICTAKLRDKKNHVCVRMRIEQSYGAIPYQPLDFEVNENCDKVLAVHRSACSCTKRHAGVVCRHRAGLLMYIWLCNVFDLSGNPGHRVKYWSRASQRKHGKGIRLVDLITDRRGVKDPNKTTKDRKARDIDKLRSEISKICRNRFSLDNAAKDKIRRLAKKHGIKKLLREDWDMPSFSGKARAGGRY